jgi:hypothetical protein
MSPHWLQSLRPKRRWFQYRLRTLFVLMTLLCLWLSHNAWRYREEQTIVARIIARDPEAQVIWGGPSWLNWLDKDSTPVLFRRVRELEFHPKTYTSEEISREILDVQLQNLSTLKQLTLMWKDKPSESDDVDALLPGIELVRRVYLTIDIGCGFIDDHLEMPMSYDLIGDASKPPADGPSNKPVEPRPR